MKVGAGATRRVMSQPESDGNAEIPTLEVALARALAQCFSDHKAEFHPLGSLGDDVAPTAPILIWQGKLARHQQLF
jgi:hypothetical protein